MRPISRRSLLSAAAAGGIASVVLACTPPPTTPKPTTPATSSSSSSAPPPPPPPPPPEKPSFMQVVAHQDDDLLFMNPDLRDSIRSGNPTVTVFITAGEAIPANAADGAAYAARRQAGSRAAYAVMAEVADEWTGEALKVDDTHQVERYTLNAKPQIQLVFMNLPENADHLAVGGPRSLRRLAEDTKDKVSVASLVPAAGKVTESYSYTRAGLVGVLTKLLAQVRPTVLRAQDNWPDVRYTNFKVWEPYHDHPDHVTAARFTDEAARAYRQVPEHRPFVHLNYRDYNLAEVPVNLSPDQQREKVAYFTAYLKHDEKATPRYPYNLWWRSMYYRWPRGTSWVGRDANGRLRAFAVRSGDLVTWWQQGDGSWTGPARLGNADGALLPCVSVASDGRGMMHVFARRLDNHHIVTIAQVAPNEWAKDWASLGNPNLPATTTHHTQVGVPVAATTGSGRLALFVKNGVGGVSVREQVSPGGAWHDAWADVGGSDVQDGLCATTTADGKVELFASTRDKVLRWAQREADQPFAIDAAFPSKKPSGPPVAAKGANGQLWVLYRLDEGGEVAASTQDASGQWSEPVVVPGHNGPGGPAAVSAGQGAQARVLVFGRDAGTGVNMARQTGPAAFGPWTGLGGETVDYATAAVAADGTVVVLGISPGGRLRVNRQNGPGPDSPFLGWQTIGE